MTMQSRALASNEIATQDRLSRRDIRTLSLASLGGALEYYDFIVAVFFTKTLASVFFPHNTPEWIAQFQVFCIFAVGYLVRPIGGVIFAHFGDRVGRKKMFALSLFLMAFPTLLIGLLPSYEAIGVAAPLFFLLCRMLQGLSVGGEVPGAWIFCAEHVHKNRVGLSCGLLMSGLCVGILLGALTAKMLTSGMSAIDLSGWGWRIPFVLGGFFGLLSVYLRRYLKETPVFEAIRARRDIDSELPISVVLANFKGNVLVSVAATWVFSGIFVVYFLYLPTYFQSQWNYPAGDVFTANCWAIVLLILGSVFAGWTADLIGGGRAYVIGGCFMFVVAFAFLLDDTRSYALELYVSGGWVIGTITLSPYVIIRSFPPDVRFTGFALSYNTAYAIFGGTAPPMMAALVSRQGFVLAPFYYMMALCVLGSAIGWFWRACDE